MGAITRVSLLVGARGSPVAFITVVCDKASCGVARNCARAPMPIELSPMFLPALSPIETDVAPAVPDPALLPILTIGCVTRSFKSVTMDCNEVMSP